MSRLFMVWAVAALMAALMAVMAAPAMAQVFFDNNDFNRGIFFGDRFNDGRFNDGRFNDGRLSSDIEQDSQSGDVSLGFRVSNSGDYASQCTPAIQEGNTGNFNNGSSFVQGGSGTNDGLRDFNGFFFGNDGFFNRGSIDDFEPGGIDVSFGGSQDVSCPSTIQQSSAASS
jgi:hypothetical protein